MGSKTTANNDDDDDNIVPIHNTLKNFINRPGESIFILFDNNPSSSTSQPTKPREKLQEIVEKIILTSLMLQTFKKGDYENNNKYILFIYF
jgi:hypothetical protein